MKRTSTSTQDPRGIKRPRPDTPDRTLRPEKRTRQDIQDAGPDFIPLESPSRSSSRAGRLEPLVVSYEPAKSVKSTTLCNLIQGLESSTTYYRQQFQAAQLVLLQLGQCASDLVWRRASQKVDESRASSVELSMLRIVNDHTFTLPNISMESQVCNVTAKFSKLVELLRAFGTQREEFRGIIYVRNSCVALALLDMIRNMSDRLSFVRACTLAHMAKLSDARPFAEICQSLENGTYNLLIATESVEDLNLPQSTVIINFDLPETFLSYSHRASCSREACNHFILMVERGNNRHRNTIARVSASSSELETWAIHAREVLVKVPPKLFDELPMSYGSPREMEELEDHIQDPTTGCTISVLDATAVIYAYAARNSQDVDEDLALFTIDEQPMDLRESKYMCTVSLPNSPVGLIIGPPSSTPAFARRLACYQACLELHVNGYLDYTYFPFPSPDDDDTYFNSPLVQEHSQSESKKDIKMDNAGKYTKKAIIFFRNIGTSKPEDLFYPNVISLAPDGTLEHNPMLLLTRHPLPRIDTFKLFGPSIPSAVQILPGAPFTLPDGKLEDLYQYNLRIYRAIFNKSVTFPLQDISYFFVPLSRGVQFRGVLPQVSQYIPWDQVKEAGLGWGAPLHVEGGNLTDELDDAVLADIWTEFTRRYDNLKLRADLSPLSKPSRHEDEDEEFNTYLDYLQSRKKGFQGLKDCGQSLVEASKISMTRNSLSPFQSWDPSQNDCTRIFVPELCVKFPIPASTFRTAVLLPCITHRIDEMLVMKELNTRLFKRAVSEGLLLQAITAPAAGMAYDYERLELLGDAYLKYLASLYVFTAYPDHKEGKLHQDRQKIISNKVLFQAAILAGLPQYIQSRPFNLKMWTPVYNDKTVIESKQLDCSAKDGNKSGSDLSMQQDPNEKPRKSKKLMKKLRRIEQQHQLTLGHKVIADVTEAIIGAAFLSGGQDTALGVAKALNVPLPNVYSWSDLDPKQMSSNSSLQLRSESVKVVEAITGFKFEQRAWLAQALTHASPQGLGSCTYERLEFIGDAILDFMAVCYLFDKYPHLSPAGLTMLKAAIVCNSALAAICVLTGLYKHIIWGMHNAARNAKLKAYLELLELRKLQEYRLAEEQGRPHGQYWADLEPPKALSDIVESVIGAIYVCDAFKLDGAQKFFDTVLKPFFDEHVTLKTLSHHPTKVLIEYIQAQGCQEFLLEGKREGDIRVCNVIVHDILLAFGEDPSSPSQAARHASASALDALEADPGFLLSTCNCRLGPSLQKKKREIKDIFSGFTLEDDEISKGSLRCTTNVPDGGSLGD